MTTALIDGLKCKACNTTKPSSEFHKDTSSKRGFAYYCKLCATSKSRSWHLNNKDNPKYKEARQDTYFKTKYNLSSEEREKILKDQDNACAICQTPLQFEGTLTHTDHCHETGRVRGILCTNCNRGLGHFKDNINNLKNAIFYLEHN